YSAAYVGLPAGRGGAEGKERARRSRARGRPRSRGPVASRREAMRRVAGTGLGGGGPNGIGKEAFWSACVNGNSGVGPIRTFDASAHAVGVAAEVPDFDVTPFVPGSHRKSLKIMGRAARFGVAAAGLAVRDSGLELQKEDPERVGVVLGTGVV